MPRLPRRAYACGLALALLQGGLGGSVRAQVADEPDDAEEGREAEGDPTEGDPAEDDPAEDDPTEDDPAETDSAEDDPAEDDPAEDDSTEDDSAEDDSAETDSAETDSAEDEPAEDDPRVSFEPGDGFTLTSADGEHALTLGVRGQIQLDASVPRDGDPGVELRIRRARVDLSGHLFGENNQFVMSLAFTPDGLGWDEEDGFSEAPLLDYYLELTHLRDLEVLIGQRRLPFARERMTSSRDLAMVDRSIVDAALGLDRDLGVWLRSRDLFGLGGLRYWLGITSGEGRNEGIGANLGFIYQARVEALPLGSFDSYTQGDLGREERPRLAIGLAYAFLDRAGFIRGLHGQRPDDGGTTDYHTAVFDLLFLYAGLTVEVDVIVRSGQRNPGLATDDAGALEPITPPSNGVGGFLQVSYVLPGVPVELAVRYAMNVALGAETETSFEDQGELGFGLNLYLAGHEYALQVDYTRLWGAMHELDRGTDRVRVQLQVTL